MIRWAWSRLRVAWRAVLTEIVYAFDLDDGRGNPSMTKMMALAMAVVGIIAILWQLSVSGNHIWLMVLAGAIAFGRHTFNKFLDRGRFSLASKDETIRETQEITVREIQERRDATTGIDPAGKVEEPFGD